MPAPITAGATPISAVVSDTTVKVSGNANLVDVACVLVQADVGLVVVEDPVPVGVVSERDLLGVYAASDLSMSDE